MEVPALIWLIALVRFSGRERGWRLAPTLGLWCRRLTPLLHCQALWLRGNRRKWEKGESRTSEEENHYFSNGQSPYLLIFVRAHTLFSLRHGMHTEKKKEKKKGWKNAETDGQETKSGLGSCANCSLQTKSFEPTGFIQMSFGRALISCYMPSCIIEQSFRNVAYGKWSSYRWCSLLWFFFVWGCVAATPVLVS